MIHYSMTRQTEYVLAVSITGILSIQHIPEVEICEDCKWPLVVSADYKCLRVWPGTHERTLGVSCRERQIKFANWASFWPSRGLQEREFEPVSDQMGRRFQLKP